MKQIMLPFDCSFLEKNDNIQALSKLTSASYLCLILVMFMLLLDCVFCLRFHKQFTTSDY